MQVVTLLPAMRQRRAKNFLLPPDANAEGGCSMTLSEVLQLLAVIGGAVFVTFQITWTISNSKKEMTAPELHFETVISFDIIGRS